MINTIWLFLILGGTITAMLTGRMEILANSIFSGLEETVEITIKLIGPLVLWSGLMKIARDADLIKILSRLFQPIFSFLFPKIPENHPAAGSILLNLSA